MKTFSPHEPRIGDCLIFWISKIPTFVAVDAPRKYVHGLRRVFHIHLLPRLAFQKREFQKHCNLVAVVNDLHRPLNKLLRVFVRWVRDYIAREVRNIVFKKIQRLNSAVPAIDQIRADNRVPGVFEYLGDMPLTARAFPDYRAKRLLL